jgi:hypothetical protein
MSAMLTLSSDRSMPIVAGRSLSGHRRHGCTADMGVPALDDGCGVLQFINVRGCRNITDMRKSAMRVRCDVLS